MKQEIANIIRESIEECTAYLSDRFNLYVYIFDDKLFLLIKKECNEYFTLTEKNRFSDTDIDIINDNLITLLCMLSDVYGCKLSACLNLNIISISPALLKSINFSHNDILNDYFDLRREILYKLNLLDSEVLTNYNVYDCFLSIDVTQ